MLDALIGDEMKILVDKIGLAYKIIPPLPFDEKKFLDKIQEHFLKKDVQMLNIGSDGVAFPSTEQYEAGSVILNYQSHRGIIGVTGNIYEDVRTELDFISDVMFHEMEVQREDVEYLELHTTGRARGKKTPLESLANLYDEKAIEPITSSFSSLDFSPMVIRLCTKDAVQDKTPFRDVINWHEFKFEPLMKNPVFYYWEFIFRNNDFEKVLDISSSVVKDIEKLLIKIESNE